MNYVKKGLILLMVLIGAGLVFAGGEKEADSAGTGEEGIKPATYTWTAGSMGGGWYTQAGAMSALIKENEPAITMKVIPGGGVANPPLVDSGANEVGWGVGWVDKAAYNGIAPLFEKPLKNFAGLAGGFSVDFYHIVAAKDTGITTLDEFVAKVKSGAKVNVAAPMAGTSDRALTSLIFEHLGISYEQMEKNGGRIIYATYADMVNLFKDRHVDYAIATLGLPGAAVTEMAISRDSTVLAVSDELIKYSHDTYGTVALETGLSFIPGGTYPGMPKDIQALSHTTEIMVNTALPDLVVYTMVKILMENIEAVQALNPSFAKYFSKKNAPNTMVPLHPGAAKYYREIGVLE
ncbi:MAG: TAXI family TRAP transporter solute-binding subunit [Spirochaetales bacterium]|nr:TAXI family TRAP transporter solute-binding subunit [Spirochaetales bacterium]